MPQRRYSAIGVVLRCWFAVLVLWCCALNPISVAHAAEEGTKPRVLLLHSYHPHFPWTDAVTRGLISRLSSRVAPEDIFVEYMDARRHEDPRHLDIFHQQIAYKYARNKPDVVVTADDAALDYMLKLGKDVFPGVPMVFTGVNNLAGHDLSHFSNLTGIKEGTDIVGTFDLITRVTPKTRKIMMLADDSAFGDLMVARARQAVLEWGLKPGKPDMEFAYNQSFTIRGLKQDLAQSPKDTAVLLLAIHRDVEGHYFSYANELPILSQASAVPIWSMWGTASLGRGVIGGMMNDGESHGAAAAKTVLEILNGVPAAFIPIEEWGQIAPKFDWNMVQRFGLEGADFPKGTIFVNRPQSVYQTHKTLVLGSGAAICGLLMVIVVLTVNVLRRKASEARLDAMNRNLETIVRQRTQELHERNGRLEELSMEMKALAHTDHLTGLGNRRSGTEVIEMMMARAEQMVTPLSIAMLDVDHFKHINDTFGHDVGDRALRVIADVARKGLRPTDYAFRWGGEELLLVFDHLDADGGLQVCERLRRYVAEETAGEDYALTISIGIAQFAVGENMRTFVHRADLALYEAKTAGRNRVVLAPPPAAE